MAAKKVMRSIAKIFARGKIYEVEQRYDVEKQRIILVLYFNDEVVLRVTCYEERLALAVKKIERKIGKSYWLLPMS